MLVKTLIPDILIRQTVYHDVGTVVDVPDALARMLLGRKAVSQFVQLDLEPGQIETAASPPPPETAIAPRGRRKKT